MNISENLQILNAAKQDIKAAIIEKGQPAGDNMHEYAEAIDNISGGGDNIDYLCFEAIEESTVGLIVTGNIVPNIEYSFDKQTWTAWDYSTINLPTGTKISFRGDNPNGLASSTSVYSTFAMTGKLAASGYLNSLLSKTDFETIDNVPDFAFLRLFQNCESLVEAPMLSGTSTGNRSFSLAFSNTGIIQCPEIPYTSIGLSGLGSMFSTCKELLYGPSVLPAVTLENTYVYQWMFSGCSKLIKAPYLPATTLKNNVYDYMFNNCTSLQYIKADFTSVSSAAASPTNHWVDGIATTGCFIKAKNATWTNKGNYACPTGWTLITSAS